MSRKETVFQNLVERMLDAGKALCRIVVLIVDMDVVVSYSLFHVLGEEALVNIGLG